MQLFGFTQPWGRAIDDNSASVSAGTLYQRATKTPRNSSKQIPSVIG